MASEVGSHESNLAIAFHEEMPSLLNVTLCKVFQHNVVYSFAATAAAHMRSRCERALGLSDHIRSIPAPASTSLPDLSPPFCSRPLLLAAAG